MGIPGEKSGRPSIKDMEKEITDRLRNQKLREERVRSDVSVRRVAPEVEINSVLIDRRFDEDPTLGKLRPVGVRQRQRCKTKLSHH